MPGGNIMRPAVVIVITMNGRDSWLSNVEFGLRNLFDPDNPFVPWLVIFDLVLLAVHLAIVYWVYRDALMRYNRGAPWATLAMLFPLGGWLFYLMYRSSALVQMDRIETELFDESEHEWTDYDTYRANQGAALFKEVGSLLRKPEAEGYSPWIRMSRARELKKKLTPEEKKQRSEELALQRKEARSRRIEARAQAREKSRQRKIERRKRTTMTGAHGFSFKLSEGRQRRLQRRLELVEKLKELPREDPVIEDHIFNMDYHAARRAATDALELAVEMDDRQGVITYEAYLERLDRLGESGTDSHRPAGE